MIAFIHSSTLLVKDQEAALRFYTDSLGFEKREDSTYDHPASGPARWLVVAPPGQKTGLALPRPQDAGQAEPGPDATNSKGWGRRA